MKEDSSGVDWTAMRLARIRRDVQRNRTEGMEASDVDFLFGQLERVEALHAEARQQIETLKEENKDLSSRLPSVGLSEGQDPRGHHGRR